MPLETWLPVGFSLPDGAKSRIALHEGPGWQILGTQGNGRALVAKGELVRRWVASGLVDEGALDSFGFGSSMYWAISSGPSQVLCPVFEGSSPDNKAEALAFALALKATREIDKESPLQDALYVEKISRLLPTYSISSRTDDDVVLGYWLTGGASVSAKSFRRLRQTLSWLGAQHLKEVVEVAGFPVTEVVPNDQPAKITIPPSEPECAPVARPQTVEPSKSDRFVLPGRPELESFFNEHIVDIIRNRERYRALGINFPSAIVLHGPPGCGKTFAVEKLVEYLGWPSFQIEASSVASPYIHETSRKVAEVFNNAIQNAPSVLVIDEMEAFLAERENVAASGHHRVEEVAEFLRRIPEAASKDVLIIAMTNKIEMIDSAILRRGRFDNVLKVDFASEEEILQLLEKLLADLPVEDGIDKKSLANKLSGRPLSDVAYVVREGARMAAKSGLDKLSRKCLEDALASTPSRKSEPQARRIGFA